MAVMADEPGTDEPRTDEPGTIVPPARPSARLDARILLAALSLVLVMIPFTLTLFLVEDRWAPLWRADSGARDGLHRYAVDHPGFVAAMQLISDSGSALAWLVVLAITVGWLLRVRLPRLALFVVAVAGGSALLNLVVKEAVHRLRPVLTDPVAHVQGLSFPSGHAQSAVVGYSVLLLVFLPMLNGVWRRVAVVVAVVMVVAIGFARVALGVHFVSDVWAGWVLGAAWVAAMAAAFDVVSVGRERRAQVTPGRSADRSQSPGVPGR
jgi:undecaprenyl-diphosphatase